MNLKVAFVNVLPRPKVVPFLFLCSQVSLHDFINDAIHELQKESGTHSSINSNPNLATPNTTSASGSTYSIANGSREQTTTSSSTTNVANLTASPSVSTAVRTPSGFSSTLNAIRKRFDEVPT